MPPRPFPQALSIGTDICHHPRFNKYFSAHNPTNSTRDLLKLFDKTLLPSEQRVFWRRFTPSSQLSSTASLSWDQKTAESAAVYLGGRWAAKEAVVKAFAGKRRLMLREIEIRRDGKTNAPFGIVIDGVVGREVEYQSAKEIYANLVQKWRVRDRIDRESVKDGDSAKDVRSSTSTPESAPTPTPTPIPRILDKDGKLDFNAFQEALTCTSNKGPRIVKTPVSERRDRCRLAALEAEYNRMVEAERKADAFSKMEGQIVKISISHDGDYCVATALAAFD
ncbi:hypothetical protein AUEXF2481DRAFT_24908 [Aureobasidium subglaciale EXF-2481]|uniref:4'-phosphopantetheinyl transferase domain-containing protein n=1 Tax=Aureobasidium subglaciale (strain EXF-2481) TaxID=1043005 RepID=A0A074YWT0_AURSE|nr:uncharacterized protein AUEXF2481DRAFT_24908 [Aureobasidium subglaciale EXF-2481]KER00600.1 hypothetical protein AUEXF2481DRAFT_24908 [Aureobasidium subglaciale EXF-2481]